jgi:hypothetical protein
MFMFYVPVGHTFNGLTSTIPTPAQPWLWPAASLAVPLKYNQNGNLADPIADPQQPPLPLWRLGLYQIMELPHTTKW